MYDFLPSGLPGLIRFFSRFRNYDGHEKSGHLGQQLLLITKESYSNISTHVLQALKDFIYWGFPGGAVVENLPANAGDSGSSPGLGGSHMLWSY